MKALSQVVLGAPGALETETCPLFGDHATPIIDVLETRALLVSDHYLSLSVPYINLNRRADIFRGRSPSHPPKVTNATWGRFAPRNCGLRIGSTHKGTALELEIDLN